MKTAQIFKPALAVIINQYDNLEEQIKQKERELNEILSDSDEKRYLEDEISKLIFDIKRLKEEAQAVERKLI